MNRTALLAWLLLVALPVAADDDPPPPYDDKQSEFKTDAPPLKVERPTESWYFLKLDELKKQCEERKQDTSGFQNLKARLYWGLGRANVYLYAQADPNAKDLEALGKARLDRIKNQLREVKVKSQGAGRVGKRAAYLFELEGKPPRDGAQAVTIMAAVVIREEDHQVFDVVLEVQPGGRP